MRKLRGCVLLTFVVAAWAGCDDAGTTKADSGGTTTADSGGTVTDGGASGGDKGAT
ncbi:MAG: hypothetical protein IT371_08055, partial [Deltaproteobacteria bacterium]|nr:hypothetical protein [Deltaproteobacteria bacterium]